MFSMQFILAARYLLGRRLRTLLTTLAIIFGVSILFGMNALIPAMSQALRQNLLSATGEVDLAITDVTDGTFAEGMADEVRAVEGIAGATGSLRRNVLLGQDQGNAAVTVAGLDPATAQTVRIYRIVDGRFLEEGDTQTIVIAESFAQQEVLEIGDTLTMPAASGTMDFEVVGISQSTGLPGVEEVFVPLSAAQKLFDQPRLINTIEAIFAPGADHEDVQAAVREALGDQYKLGQLEAGRTITQNLALGEIIVNMFGVAALAMGGFIIFITFRTILVERRRDIGMLRAIGASRGTILSTILAESVLQGAVGTAIGLLLGWLMGLGVLAVMEPIYEEFLHLGSIEPVFSIATIGAAIGMGIGVTVLGGLLPALSATRVSPLDALRPILAEVYDRAAGRGAIIGAVLMVLAALGLLSGQFGLVTLGFLAFIVGLILVIPAIVKPIASIFGRLLAIAFAREGQIAQGNMTRQPGRAAVTATVMMIGLALVVALIGMMTSLENSFMKFLDTSLGVDFILMPQSILLSSGNVGANPELADRIEEIEGVETVTTLRIAGSTLGDTALQVVGIDPSTYGEIAGLEFTAGSPQEAFNDLNDGRAAVINGLFASTSSLAVGDVIMLKTPEGEHEYTIVGIGTDYLNAKLPTAYISQDNLAADFHQTSDLLIMVQPTADADKGVLRREINQVIEDYPTFTLFSFQEFRKSQADTFKQVLYMMWGLAALLAVPSLIALMNTQAINVMERTREIGMIRAVGATKRQIRRIILAETLLLAATGTAFGILGGLWLSYVMVTGLGSVGYSLGFYFPWGGALAALAIGMLFGVMASLIPANQAAKLQIVQALRYE